MIGHMRGTILETFDNGILLEVGDIGYEVMLDPQSLAGLPPIGTKIALTIRTIVREDAIILYGFTQAPARSLFDMLTQVSGIGPKIASQILGFFPLAELVGALAERNIAQLVRIPGVGKKTAERLSIELSDKVGLLPIEPESTAGIPLQEDVRSALLHLGFSNRDIDRAFGRMEDETLPQDLEGMLRAALSHINTR